MCKDCKKYRQLWINSLINNLNEGLDFYMELKEKYGSEDPAVKELEILLIKIRNLLDAKASSR
jgi:hypothetical protein